MTSTSLPTIPAYIERFEQMAYGLFLHYGLYSLLERGEWAISMESIPSSEYAKLADRFTASKFDGRAIGSFAAASGMRYAVLTARHHDGFSLYDTKGLSKFDAVHAPSNRDLVANFIQGCRDEGITPFLYHTTLDWSHNTVECDAAEFSKYLDYLFASVELLCTEYGEIGGLWFDGNWSRTDVDWREGELYDMIRSHQPDAMIINNSGLHRLGEKTHPQLDAVTFERGSPSRTQFASGERYVATEMAQTTCKHWGVARDDFQHTSPASIIRDLCLCRGANANLLLNVGPLGDGSISDLNRAVLLRVGEWVKRYDEIIRLGRATDLQCEGDDFVLAIGKRRYLFAHNLPARGDVNVSKDGNGVAVRTIRGLDRPIRKARWLDLDEQLDVSAVSDDAVAITLTGFPYGKDLVVRVAELSD